MAIVSFLVEPNAYRSSITRSWRSGDSRICQACGLCKIIIADDPADAVQVKPKCQTKPQIMSHFIQLKRDCRACTLMLQRFQTELVVHLT